MADRSSTVLRQRSNGRRGRGGDIDLLFPEGLDPVGVDPEIFKAAFAPFVSGVKLDMRHLAAELSIGRSTLYRKVENREHLLGQLSWFSARRLMAASLGEVRGLSGADRISKVVSRFIRKISEQEGFRRFLLNEPETALRVLTSRDFPVQPGLVAFLERFFDLEEERGNLKLTLDKHTLAYVIVRVGEGFLYADLLADNHLDHDQAEDVVARLIRG